MPPRHAYWTIIFGNQPTSFRAATREELLPTLKQIQSRHPDAVMMWFARGRLWQSDEEAREALRRRQEEKSRRFRRESRPDDRRGPRFGDSRRPQGGERRPWTPKPPGGDSRPRPPKPRSGEGARGRDWRPGGEHKDPRDRFKVPRDVKRARFKAQLRRDRVDPRAPRPDRPGRPRGPHRPRPPKKDEK